MTDPNASPYDGVDYPGQSYPFTHPAHLATVGALYGMEPAPVATCRVLELGCGHGMNLLPMADRQPDASFVGIDLSGRSIEVAANAAAACGVRNVEFRHGNIMEVDAQWGRFDYIIAHGVYSWVPAEVREKILTIVKENLSPHGVAYVSYNAYPGSHLRNLTRDMMLFHTRYISDPQERVRQARVALLMATEASDSSKVYGSLLRDRLERVERMPDQLLLHDDLLEIATPFLLHEMVADAERHGLQYLSDANLWRRDLRHYPEDVRRILLGLPETEFVARDQYQDFIDGHGFRNTLLCHAEVPLNRSVRPDHMGRFFFSCSAAPVSEDVDPASSDTLEFKGEEGAVLASDRALVKAALLELQNAWPGSLGFDELLERAVKRSGVPVDGASQLAGHRKDLSGILFQAVFTGHVGIHKEPPKLATRVSRKPEASVIARKQAETGFMITNLRHRLIKLEDDKVRRFLRLLDGTRDIDDLTADFAAGAPPDAPPDDLTRETIERNLGHLANLALLVA